MAFLSLDATANDGPLSKRVALGLEVLDWKANAYVESWAHVVDGSGRHEHLARSEPVFRLVLPTGADTRVRPIPLSNGSRHWNLHDVTEQNGRIVGYGFADAPMTHSADGGNTAARTFGTLRIELE